MPTIEDTVVVSLHDCFDSAHRNGYDSSMAGSERPSVIGRGRISELEALIRKHQELYYNHEPEISDDEFDALWVELEEIDPQNHLLAGIGLDRQDGWPKVRHMIPMGSQSKASDPEAFTAWAAKVGYQKYVVEYKLDGASIELQYLDGVLSRAVTRGDGSIGDEITINAIKMRGVPKQLPVRFSGGVRGEVLMSRAIHEKKYPDKANCRNAANGIMKRKDGVGAEDLDVICYDAAIVLPDSHGGLLGVKEKAGSESLDGFNMQPLFKDEPGKIEWLGKMGFTTVTMVILGTVEEVISYRARIMTERTSLAYDIDGLVVKGIEIDSKDSALPRPEKQIAFKFSPEEAVTTLIAVEWSGSGANYTPIGIVEPVRLAGTTVQRANLCNPDMIRDMVLKIGSKVVITKRGEIIPKIETLVENPDGSMEIEIPTTCSSCGTTLVDAGSRLYCPNPACSRKTFHRLEKWLSVLDVKEFGSAILGKLVDSGKVRTIADLYSLEVEDLVHYDRMGRVLAEKILRNLREKSEIGFPDFLAGFDIEGIGPLIAQKLSLAGFSTLDALGAAHVEDLEQIEGIAEITAKAIVDGVADLRVEMEAVLATGKVRIRPLANMSLESEGGKSGIAGMIFCFTGELATMKRQDAERRVRELGGIAKNSVTKDLDYLVTNDSGSGSEKNRKALDYGVAIIDEAKFLTIISGDR
jgi:DNA ligase (NAD+)